MEQIYKKAPEIIKLASRELRKNMTLSEKKLWVFLRRDILNIRWLRQKPIYLYTEH